MAGFVRGPAGGWLWGGWLLAVGWGVFAESDHGEHFAGFFAGFGVHEEVLHEDLWGGGVRVAVAGVVGADGFAFEGVAGGLVEAGGEGVGEGVAFGGVAGPAGSGVPAGVVAGGVDVDGDEEDVGCADGVGAEDAFFEGDVCGFGDEELGVVAFGLEGCEDLVGEVAGVGVFEEGAVWGAFAGGVVAVGGV